VKQIAIDPIERMPNRPTPWRMRDWCDTAHRFDKLAFDFDARGEHLPLIWLDQDVPNPMLQGPGFGMPSYVGGPNSQSQNCHEAIAGLGAVVGSSLADIDKRQNGYDFVAMACQYFNGHNDENLILNMPSTESGLTYWYEVFPHMLFYMLVDLYPRATRLPDIMQITADRWFDACRDMADENGELDFDHTAFDFKTRQPVDNGKWIEPDAAGGIAWLLHSAHMRYPHAGYLDQAVRCMDYLDRRTVNPLYEIMLPFAVTLAARMNAELGKDYDVAKMITWLFGPSDSRPGWGVITESWGGLDCYGLCGSITDGGGYAFAMNTFLTTAIVLPAARYDARYARAIGKWLTHAANNARLFYPDELPDDQQSCPDWKPARKFGLCYEGLRKDENGKSPFATGDATRLNWGGLDYAIYGSAYAGMYAATVGRTNVDGVVLFHCNPTDFFNGPAYPTYLTYNSNDQPVTITHDFGPEPHGIYDAVAHEWISRETAGEISIDIPADTPRLLVRTAANPRLSEANGRLLDHGVVIDYRYND